MQVRKFETKDSDNVKGLILSILTKEYPFDKSVYEDSDISSIRGVYGGKRDDFLVLESDGKILGTIGIKEESEDTALIRRLFVDPSCRRKGYGALLMDKAIRHCKKNNFKNIVFRTTGRMVQAINLVKKMKFKEVERLDLGGFQIYKFMLELR
ncbi:MAG: GNAT family N-acetyltransferase [Candidatus Omnitrophica bacterium]|nr:GNAT family N-acetyltransferase [Candidatus Omnitrophota bacterium]